MAASRDSGAGEIRSATNISALSIADSIFLLGCPRNRRNILFTIFLNRLHTLIFSPLAVILPSLAWNSGLLNASATNSSRLVAPYAVSNWSLIDSNRARICLAVGVFFAISWEVTACIASWSRTWFLRSASWFRVIVSVLGSYKPATVLPSAFTKPLTITTLVLSKPFPIAVATRDIVWFELCVRSLIAPRKSPASSLARICWDSG